jgi:outer membrane protein TolC
VRVDLSGIIDLALRNNAATRATWLQASAAEARAAGEESALRPKVNLLASVTAREAQGGNLDTQFIGGPSLALTWLLYDHGGTAAAVEGARLSLEAANWSHNGAVMDTVHQAVRAYYLYLAAGAALEARRASLRQAEAALEAAEGRQRAGTATAADALQAKASVARSRLALETAEGSVLISRGSLAASMGFPADQPLEVVAASIEPDPERDLPAVESFIRQSLARRPELEAARSLTRAVEAQVRRISQQRYPTLSLLGGAGLTGLWVDAEGYHTERTTSVGLALSVPLTTGGTLEANLLRARREAESSREREKSLEVQVITQVFTSWQLLGTAGTRIRAARDFLDAARRAEEMAQGRYREGVGTILELVTAQSDLAEAQLQDVQARYGWFIALTQLARDAGLLERDGRMGPVPTGGTP